MHARNVRGDAADDVARQPRWSTHAQLCGASLPRGLTLGTPFVSTVGRNTVRGARVVTRSGSCRPSGVEVHVAGVEGEGAGVDAVARRPTRKSAKSSETVREPSATREPAALLRNLRSRSSLLSMFSINSRRVDGTIEMVMPHSWCLRLGAHTPMASDKLCAGARLVSCSMG